jgi:hypothetical protein
MHGKAMSVYDVSKLRLDTNAKDDAFCEWLGMKVPDAGSEFELTCDNKELAGLGPGFPLYFEFKKQLLIAVTVLGLLVGIINVAVMYSAYTNHQDNLFYTNLPVFIRVSIGAGIP